MNKSEKNIFGDIFGIKVLVFVIGFLSATILNIGASLHQNNPTSGWILMGIFVSLTIGILVWQSKSETISKLEFEHLKEELDKLKKTK